eukprot:247405-Amphidinium_carterae.1
MHMQPPSTQDRLNLRQRSPFGMSEDVRTHVLSWLTVLQELQLRASQKASRLALGNAVVRVGNSVDVHFVAFSCKHEPVLSRPREPSVERMATCLLDALETSASHSCDQCKALLK